MVLSYAQAMRKEQQQVKNKNEAIPPAASSSSLNTSSGRQRQEQEQSSAGNNIDNNISTSSSFSSSVPTEEPWQKAPQRNQHRRNAPPLQNRQSHQSPQRQRNPWQKQKQQQQQQQQQQNSRTIKEENNYNSNSYNRHNQNQKQKQNQHQKRENSFGSNKNKINGNHVTIAQRPSNAKFTGWNTNNNNNNTNQNVNNHNETKNRGWEVKSTQQQKQQQSSQPLQAVAQPSLGQQQAPQAQEKKQQTIKKEPQPTPKKPKQQQQQKSKKPKQKLKTMCIGDLIGISTKSTKQPSNNNNNKNASSKTTPAESTPKPFDPSDFPPIDFPALPKSDATNKNTATTTITKRPPPPPATVTSATTSSKKASVPIKLSQPIQILSRNNVNNIKSHNNNSNTNSNNNKSNPQPTNKKAAKLAPPASTHPAMSSASAFFAPKPIEQDDRRGGGDELFKLLKDANVYQKKGRQRVAPRKKKFSTLKKKVLYERLKKWKELHPDKVQQQTTSANVVSPEPINKTTPATTVTNFVQNDSPCICIYGFVTSKEELEDDDEYQELESNLTEMAQEIGTLDGIHIPKDLLSKDREDQYPVFVKFTSSRDAAAAKACWDNMVVGGIALQVLPISLIEREIDSDNNNDDDTKDWKQVAMANETQIQTLSSQQLQQQPVEIVLEQVLTQDDYDDEDCMAESLSDIENVARTFGNLLSISQTETEANNNDDDHKTKTGNVHLIYESGQNGPEIANQLCQIQLGGQALRARLIQETNQSSDMVFAFSGIGIGTSLSNVLLEDILTDDDLDDDDCLEESINDIQNLASLYGTVVSVARVDGTNNVHVTFDNVTAAQEAVVGLSATCIGGSPIRAHLLESSSPSTSPQESNCIFLSNVLTDDDMEDPDCLQESLADIQELASNYGTVERIDLVDNTSRIIRIRYCDAMNDSNSSIIKAALNGFDGMVIGGQIISASLSLSANLVTNDDTKMTAAAATSSSADQRQQSGKRMLSSTVSTNPSFNDVNTSTTTTTPTNVAKKARTDDLPPLYSNDKLISERFAECKRVPKIPNAGTPRAYATVCNDERAKPLLTEMLSELMRLQKRAVEEKNAKAKRRIVMGLREVARGIRSHKVKMVVMAHNLDDYGVIDEKLQEIIDLANKEDVPLFFEFSKRALGKAVGKSIKVAVVGIQNAEGAHAQFKKLVNIAATTAEKK